MKQLVTLGVLAFLGVLGLSLIFSSQERIATANDNVVLFGRVDTSDADDADDEMEDVEVDTDQESEAGWFENFIKDHKTPFSKSIEE